MHAEARREMPGFYATAANYEVLAMDALVLSLAGLTVGVRASRRGVDHETRLMLEKACDGSERIFAVLRHAVRGCEGYRRLSPADQQDVERFAMTPPVAPTED